MPMTGDATRAIRSRPGSIDQAHGAVEFVDLAEVDRAYEFYREFVMRFT